MSKIAVLVVGIALVFSPIFGQQGNDKQEAYTAVAMGTGGATGGKSISFDFRVSRFTVMKKSINWQSF